MLRATGSPSTCGHCFDLDLLRRRLQITKAASEVSGQIEVGPTKTGKSRSVHLPKVVADSLASHLAQHPSKEGLLFAAAEGGVIRRTNFRRRVWKPALRASGIAFPMPRVHDLRHTAASLAIQAGAHPKAIQEMLGHSSITITLDRYGHMFPSVAESLADALDRRFRDAEAELAAPSLPPDSQVKNIHSEG